MYDRRNDYLRRRDERRRGRDYRSPDYRGGYQDYRRGPQGRDYEYRGSRDYAGYDSTFDPRFNTLARHYEYPMVQNYDYHYEEKEYEKDLHEWIDKLKKKDRFGIPKEQIIHQAKNMGVMFRDYTEEEFYAAYLAMVTDYKKVSNEYNMYIQMAKEFLEDDDTKASNSEKLCKYLYYIVLGEE